MNFCTRAVESTSQRRTHSFILSTYLSLQIMKWTDIKLLNARLSAVGSPCPWHALRASCVGQPSRTCEPERVRVNSQSRCAAGCIDRCSTQLAGACPTGCAVSALATSGLAGARNNCDHLIVIFASTSKLIATIYLQVRKYIDMIRRYLAKPHGF